MSSFALIAMNRRLALTAFCFAGTIAVACFVVAAQVMRVLNNPFCCADDGYFSIVARHLAETGSYALPTADNQANLFDAAIGSGPPLILSGALAVAVFGPSAPLLPFVVLTILASQIATATWFLARRCEPGAVALYIAAALLAFYIVTVRHPYHGSFIGEGVTFGFVFLGCALLVSTEATFTTLALAGLSLSMAILTKNMAVLSVAGACAVWFAREVFADTPRKLRRACILAASIALPIAAFELIQFVSLGAAGYREHWHVYFAILTDLHPAKPNRMQGVARVFDTYSVTLAMAGFVLLSFITLVVLLIVGRLQRDTQSTEGIAFGLMLFAAATAHLIYSIFVSRLWVRYFWLGIMLGVFAAATPILIPKWRVQLAAIVAFFVLLANPGALAKAYQLHSAGAKNGNADELRRAIAFVEQRPGDRVLSQSWHTGHSMIYLLKRPRSWLLSNSDAVLPGYRGLIVIDQRFEGREYPFSKLAHQLCENAFPTHTTFTVLVCDGKTNATLAGPASPS